MLRDDTPITDDMVERAAVAIRNVEAEDHGWPTVDTLGNVLVPRYYRAQARAALEAAFGDSDA